jgi:hypothetical protein
MKRIGIAMILALAGTAKADSIGRLFFTPEQRVVLDNARGQKVKIEVEAQSEEPAPDIVSLNGVVKRDDGHTTVWLNNRAVSDHRTTGGVTIHPQGSASDPVLFTIPQAERVVTLRVGQNLDVTTGQVVEPYSPKAAEMKQTLAAKQDLAGQGSKQEAAQALQRRGAAGSPSAGVATSTLAPAEPKDPTSIRKPAP